MKKTTLVLLIACTLMSCSKLYKNDTVLSKYSNDTLYTKVIPTNEKVVFNDANVVFEKTANPSLKIMQKKARINAATAEEWIKRGSSYETIMNTDSGLTGWGIALIVLGVIVLIVAILLFLATKELANGIAGVIDAVRQGFNRGYDWRVNTLSFFYGLILVDIKLYCCSKICHMGKYKKRSKGNITKALIKEETKHNHIIPDRIQHKLKKSGKESFLLIKKKKKKPCDKKKGYFDLTEVNKVIAWRQAAQPGLYLRSYKCDFCRKYHLTGMSEEDNAKRVLMFDAMTDKNISKRKIQLLKGGMEG